MDEHRASVDDLKPLAYGAILEGDAHIRGVHNVGYRRRGHADLYRCLIVVDALKLLARRVALAMLDAQYLAQVVDVELDIGYCLYGNGYRNVVAIFVGDGYQCR